MVEKEVTDQTLIKQFKKGSIIAYEELISRYEAKIFNMALRLTRNQEDAEEVLQDVFSTVYNKVSGFEGKSAFSSWLYRIVVNASFMKLRKRKQNQTVYLEDLTLHTQQHYLDNDPQFVQRGETVALNREIRATLSSAIERLPDQYQAVFVLRDVDGLSNNEVGEILNLSVPAVKSRLHRSRMMLRKKLLRYYKEFSGRKNVQIDDPALDAELK